MRAVDTNMLVRLIVRDDPEQARVAQEFIAGGAWVSHLVLAETIWVLDALYERTSEQIAVALDMLLNHKDLSLQDADVVTLALDQFRKRPALGFSDCLTLETARRAGHLPLGSFDRNLAKLEGVERLREVRRLNARQKTRSPEPIYVATPSRGPACRRTQRSRSNSPASASMTADRRR